MSKLTTRIAALLLCAMTVCQARAETCQERYDAIKHEAMYCGFFCDWQKIRLLQVGYEDQCMLRSIPLSMFDRDVLADDSTVNSISADDHLGGRSADATRGGF